MFRSAAALLFPAFVLSTALPLAGQDSAPPLPDWNESSSADKDGTLLPEPGALPDISPAQPVELPPLEQIPDLAPLQGPSDGEAMPEIEGLPPVRHSPQAKPPTPQNPQSQPQGAPKNPDTTKLPVARVFWHGNPREARKQSLKENKPMLFVFGGFRWSPACQALNDDVFFANEDFNRFAAENLVVTYQDVVTKTFDMDAKRQAKLDELKSFRQFLKVRRLPTLILFDGEGREVDRMVGYNFNRQLRPASAIKLIDRLKTMTTYCLKRRDEQERKRKLLADVQGYEWWTSGKGTRLFAKVVEGGRSPAPTEENPDATEAAVIFMDETGKRRTVALRLLSIESEERARRQLSARSPPPASSEEKSAAAAPNTPS